MDTSRASFLDGLKVAGAAGMGDELNEDRKF